MRKRVYLTIVLFALVLCGCAGEATTSTVDDFATRPVTLPDGAEIRAEVMIHQKDIARGMMFRDSLPEGRGMLFIHSSPGRYQYWAYQVKVPLDIVWLDKQRRVVEVVANAAPCVTKASQCPQFGGAQEALVVLELPAGAAAKHGIKTGEVVQF